MDDLVDDCAVYNLTDVGARSRLCSAFDVPAEGNDVAIDVDGIEHDPCRAKALRHGRKIVGDCGMAPIGLSEALENRVVGVVGRHRNNVLGNDCCEM